MVQQGATAATRASKSSLCVSMLYLFACVQTGLFFLEFRPRSVRALCCYTLVHSLSFGSLPGRKEIIRSAECGPLGE
eukprot:4331460-Amphidinium_carterae.1